MALVRKLRGVEPHIGEGTFLAETAVLVGDVTVGRDCSIWYNAVLRGDVNSITVGDRTNIQDGVVIHTLWDGSPHPSQTVIGSDVSVGHNAIIHRHYRPRKLVVLVGFSRYHGAFRQALRHGRVAGALGERPRTGRGLCGRSGEEGTRSERRTAKGYHRAHRPRLHALRIVV